MAVVFLNNAATTLASNLTSSATSIVVTDGSVLPTLSGSDYTYLTLEAPLTDTREVVKLTARSGNTLTVVRAQDSSSASAFSAGDKCELRITAALLNDLNTEADTESVSRDGDSMTGNLSFGDNNKAIFGAGSDLQVYHSGSASIIGDFGTGDLLVRGENLKLQNTAGENYLVATNNDATRLYHDNAEKLATTSTGIDVTGSVVSDGLTVNSGATDEVARFEGTGSPYVSWYDSGVRQAYIGSLGNNFSIVGDTPDTTVSISTGGVNRVTVTSTGIDVTGSVSADGLTVDGDILVNRTSAFTNAAIEAQDDGSGEVLALNNNGTDGQSLRLYNSGTLIGGLGNSTSDVSSLNIYRGSTPAINIKNGSGDISFYDTDGTTASFVYDASAGLTINEAGANRDFRVESDVISHMLFVDAGSNKVGINISNPGRLLTIQGTSGDNLPLRIMGGANTTSAAMEFQDPTTTADYKVVLGSKGDDLYFQAGGSQKALINASGNFRLESSSPYFRTKNSSAPTDEKAWDYNAGTDGTFRFRATNDAGTDSNNWMVVDRSGVDINYIAMSTGNQVERMRLSASSATFNETGVDSDFRVESNNNSHMLFVNAGLDQVAIGSGSISAPSGYHLLSYGSGSGARSAFVHGAGDGGIVVSGAAGGSAASVIFGNNWGTNGATFSEEWRLFMDGADDSLKFKYNANQNTALTLSNAGAATFNGTVETGGTLYIPQWIEHSGDSNTYFGFPSGDEFKVVTANIGRLHIKGSESVWNEGGENVDFRVESDSQTHALFVNAGDGEVSVNSNDINACFGVMQKDDGASGDIAIRMMSATNEQDVVLRYQGRDHNGSYRYADIVADFDGGNERLQFKAPYNTTSPQLELSSSHGAVFNEGSGDRDFRVESDSNTHMLFVDASGETVQVGHGNAGFAELDVQGDISIRGPSSFGTLEFRRGSASLVFARMGFDDPSQSNDTFVIDSSGNGNPMGFITNDDPFYFWVSGDTSNTADVRIENAGGMVINENGNDSDFRVESDNNSHMLFVEAASDCVSIGSSSDKGATLNIEGNVRRGGYTTLSNFNSNNDVLAFNYNIPPSSATVTPIYSGSVNAGGSFIHMGSGGHGTLDFRAAKHGTDATAFAYTDAGKYLSLDPVTKTGGTLIANQDSRDIDFRVESDSNASMLFVDAANNSVNIGTTGNSGYALNVAGTTRVQNNLKILSTGGQNLTQGHLLISSSTTDSPAARGQGVFMFNEGTDTTWYAGTGYNAGGHYHIGFAASSAYTNEGARLTNAHFSLYNDATGAVFNENGLDRDFRVESESQTNGFIINGAGNFASFGNTVKNPSSGFADQHGVGIDLLTGETQIAADTTPLSLNRTSTAGVDGTYLELRGGSVVLGAIKISSSDNLEIQASSGGGAGLTLWGAGGSTPTISPIQTTNGTTNLGRTSERFGRLHLQDGIQDGGSAGSSTVFNDDSTTADFRVESDSNTHALFVDAGANSVRFMKDSGSNTVSGMMWNHNDYLGITTTSTDTGDRLLLLNRQGGNGDVIEFRTVNVKRGEIEATSSGVTYSTTSDRRLKKNIETITDGTDKLMAMNPVTHGWKADPEADSVHGFIAQEMLDIVPEAVSGDPEGDEMMSMDYGRITPVLVAALQDAHKKIAELETRLNELEGK